MNLRVNKSDRDSSHRTLLLVVADGVRHDVLVEELDAGNLPALSARRARGGLYEVSTSFPSVTGSAYVPFLTGRFPGSAGLPGLRWYDRTRRVGLWPSYSRSYAGIDIWHVDRDLDKRVPTLMELARPSLTSMSMLGRGANRDIGRSVAWMLRATKPHFSGNSDAWRGLELRATREFLSLLPVMRPRVAVLVLTGPDKRAHKEGARSAGVRTGLLDLDVAVKSAEEIARSGGWLDSLDVWLVGDHGHAPVSQHEDMHGWLEQRGLRVRAHPQVFQRSADVALMVGGNAMAHVYLEPHRRERAWWPDLVSRWQSLHDAMLERDAVDLIAVAESANAVRVSSSSRGSALIRIHEGAGGVRWSYERQSGDPLALGNDARELDAHEAHDAALNTPYPDSIVQVASITVAPRSGDLVVSASEHWDLRARYEPVTHVSTHGALLREQMIVPLLVDRPVARTPQRTADVMPSALELLELPVPDNLDGRSFLSP